MRWGPFLRPRHRGCVAYSTHPSQSAASCLPPGFGRSLQFERMNPVQRLARSGGVGLMAARIFAGYRWVSWRNRRLPEDEAARRLSAYYRRSAQLILEPAMRRQGLLIKVGELIGGRA